MKRFICAVLLMLFAAVPSQSSETVLGIAGNEVALLGANTWIKGDAAQFNATVTTYGSSSCARLNGITSTDGVGVFITACTNETAALFIGRSFLLTRFVLSTREPIAADSTASCVFRLIDLDDAEIPGSELSITPLTAQATGKVYSVNINHLMSAGDTTTAAIRLQVKDGATDTCANGSSCICDENLPNMNINFFGVWQ